MPGVIGWQVGVEARPSVELHERGTVDRVVEGLADAQVIERRKVRVERQEVDRELGVDVQLGRVLQLEPVELCEWGLAEEPGSTAEGRW